MTFKTQLSLILAALLLTASMALASPAAPESPQAPTSPVVQPLAAPFCAGADSLAFTLDPQPTASGNCGFCSDAVCVGKMVNAVCGSGFRCIPTGTCSAVAIRRCQCLII